jgi:hypothetical protein
LGDGKHASIDIEANYTPGTHAFGGQPGDDASAACEIEHSTVVAG